MGEDEEICEVDGNKEVEIDDTLSIYTQIQLRKEPTKGIMKVDKRDGSTDEKERWNAIPKCLTFFGVSPDDSADFVRRLSRRKIM